MKFLLKGVEYTPADNETIEEVNGHYLVKVDTGLETFHKCELVAVEENSEPVEAEVPTPEPVKKGRKAKEVEAPADEEVK